MQIHLISRTFFVAFHSRFSYIHIWNFIVYFHFAVFSIIFYFIQSFTRHCFLYFDKYYVYRNVYGTKNMVKPQMAMFLNIKLLKFRTFFYTVQRTNAVNPADVVTCNYLECFVYASDDNLRFLTSQSSRKQFYWEIIAEDALKKW